MTIFILTSFCFPGMETVDGREVIGASWKYVRSPVFCIWSIEMHSCGSVMRATKAGRQTKYVICGFDVGQWEFIAWPKATWFFHGKEYARSGVLFIRKPWIIIYKWPNYFRARCTVEDWLWWLKGRAYIYIYFYPNPRHITDIKYFLL